MNVGWGIDKEDVMKRTHHFIASVCALLLAGCSSVLPPSPAPQRNVNRDLIRTYASEPLSGTAILRIDDIYETRLEEVIRTEFIDEAARQGLQNTADGTLRLSLIMDEETQRAARRAESIVRITSSQITIPGSNHGEVIDETAGVGFVFGNRDKGQAHRNATMRLRLILSDGETSYWTGVAHAELDGRPRTALARAMARELGALIGQDTDLPAMRFTPAPEEIVELQE